jgi:hypothetical protein
VSKYLVDEFSLCICMHYRTVLKFKICFIIYALIWYIHAFHESVLHHNEVGLLKVLSIFCVCRRIFSVHTAAGRCNVYLLYSIINLHSYGIILSEYWHYYAPTTCWDSLLIPCPSHAFSLFFSHIHTFFFYYKISFSSVTIVVIILTEIYV